MKASEVKLQHLLDGRLQYQVPLFQRTYEWEEKHWQTLWDDILEIYYLDEPRGHFMGAIVTLPIPDAPERAAKHMLIDGQQRLTTLFIILAAIRSAAKVKDKTLENVIQDECLTNPHALTPEEKEKLRPTQRDRELFRQVINDEVPAKEERIGEAWHFYTHALELGDLEGNPLDLRKLKTCITHSLELVSIKIEQDDSPHRIFESLNYKGMPLSASDLVRNYVFMQLHEHEQLEELYTKYWYPMQDDLGESLTGFFWRYLMMDGDLPRYDDVYEAMQKKLGHEDIPQALEKLKGFSSYYLRFLRPEEYEKNKALSEQLKRLNDWEVDVAYPFMLTMFDALTIGEITEADIAQVLSSIESFVVRRTVCGIPTNRLRRIFANMSNKVSTDEYVKTCQTYLQQNEWPSDREFYEKFQTFRAYIPSRLSRTRLILSSMERSFEHKEPVEISDQITIEHIMPQTLDDEWRKMLGYNADEVYSRLLHTIGNLTFSGYNKEMQNFSFEKKKSILSESHFELNTDVLTYGIWNEESILARAKRLADRALTIWASQVSDSLVNRLP